VDVTERKVFSVLQDLMGISNLDQSIVSIPQSMAHRETDSLEITQSGIF
jgi:hypothetical protein